MKVLVVHSRFIPSAPNGVLSVDKNATPSQLKTLRDSFRKMFEDVNNIPILLVQEGYLKFKAFNKNTGRYPRATFVAALCDDNETLNIGIAVCSEKDQFDKKKGVKLAKERVLKGNIKWTLQKDTPEVTRKDALKVLNSIVSGFYMNVGNFKRMAHHQQQDKGEINPLDQKLILSLVDVD